MPSKPLVGVTMGDPAGVGPEVTVKALTELGIYSVCRPLVVGDAAVLARANEMLETPLIVRPVARVNDARFEFGTMDVLDLANVELGRLETGKISAMAGKAAVEYVIQAVQLVQAGEMDAMVTGPINKEAINLGGYHYIGHTEILADLTHTTRLTTMLASGPLRVTHVTRHVPLGAVSDLITRDRVLETILVTAKGLRQFGIEQARLGVAALNPHGGEGGLLGREEIEEIAPAVEKARKMGINAQGPFPGDSIFFRAIDGEFDAVVAMYHDQGHIPIKVYDFQGSYTVTLGLPILRTSVDHGTAFDIAWKGMANSRSMLVAIQAAALLARQKEK